MLVKGLMGPAPLLRPDSRVTPELSHSLFAPELSRGTGPLPQGQGVCPAEPLACPQTVMEQGRPRTFMMM